MPSTLCRCSELVANVTPFRRNKSPKINQQIPSTCAPSNFVRSVLPFVTTTRGSSECRPDDKAEATSRFVVLCDVKQGPQGFVADPKKPARFPGQRCRVHVRQDLSAVNLSRVQRKKSGAVPCTDLPTGTGLGRSTSGEAPSAPPFQSYDTWSAFRPDVFALPTCSEAPLGAIVCWSAEVRS